MPNRRAGEAAATAAGERRAEADLRLPGRGTKRKVSLTIDESLLEDLRALSGGRPLSSVVNSLLSRAVEQERLGALVDELIAEAGEPPPEAYQSVLDQWEKGLDQWEKGRK